MATAVEISALQKDKLKNCVGVVWVTRSGSKVRVPLERECPGCKAQYRLKGGKPDEHMCRILHCKKCPLHFCWFCLASDLCYPQIPCVVNGNIYEACVNRVVTNV